MNIQADKASENRKHNAANSIAQKRNASKPTFQFRESTEMVAQRKLMDVANSSSGASQLKAFQDIANSSIQNKQATQLSAIPSYPISKPSQKESQLGTTNQSPLQFRLYKKDSDLRNLVKEAAKTAQPNSTAILLEIYNEMRHEIDPTPGPFNSLVNARAAMIAANRIDAEDADFLALEAARMQQAGGDPAEALRLRIVAAIADKRDGIEGKYGHHIFKGDYNSDGIPTGFHSKADGSATHETYGGTTDVGNVGAYQQSVRRKDNQTKKPIQSTFFPDGASHDNVIDAITVVYGYGLSTVAHVDASVNGMRLEKKGNTVFPAGGSDNRFAE